MKIKTLFGSYYTRNFSDIFSKVEDFTDYYNNCGIPKTITEDNIKTLYYLLLARYGNSHISNTDENQFKNLIMTTIFMYGPAWEKRLEIQSTLRNLSEDDIIKGAKQINNHSYNPSTMPSTNSLEELPTINEQNTSQYKKSKLDAYNLLWNLITTDVTEEFLSKFKKYFLSIVSPQKPLWYVTDTEEE